MMTLRRRSLVLLVATTSIAACGGGQETAEMAQSSWPPYEGQMRELFDDQIDPAAVGLAMDGSSPAHDPLLRPRAQAADLVARMRVQTVTRDSVGARTSYVLNLQVGRPELMPPKLEQPSVEITITPEQGSFGIVQSLESSLRGRTFIGFVKRFAGPEAGPELHWHFTADSEEVAQVIEEVRVMEELTESGKEQS